MEDVGIGIIVEVERSLLGKGRQHPYTHLATILHRSRQVYNVFDRSLLLIIRKTIPFLYS